MPEVEEYFSGFLAFIDTTVEQKQIPRPKAKEGKEGRYLYYQNKRKKHIVKNQYTVNQPGLIHKTKNKWI